MSSWYGKPSAAAPTSAAAATCSGRPAAAANIPRVSRRSDVTWSTSCGLGCGLDSLGLRLGHQPFVLGIVNRFRFIHEHHRNVVANLIATLQPRVVERVLALEVRAEVPCLRDRRGCRAVADQEPSWLHPLVMMSRTLSDVLFALGAGSGFEVEAQQWFGVRRPQVEPPVAEIDGEAVEPILLGIVETRRPPARSRRRGSSTLVLISPESAYRSIRLAQLRQGHAGRGTAARERASRR